MRLDPYLVFNGLCKTIRFPIPQDFSIRGEFPMPAKKTGPQLRPRSVSVNKSLQLRPVGVIRSILKSRSDAPKQGSEGAPDAWLEVRSFATQALHGLSAGDNIIVITWFHRATRDTLKVHPRSDPRRRLTGVFATRSPDRPNPLGLHRVTVRRIAKNRLLVGPIEAIDGTPVVDIKIALPCLPDS
jgi:tRNA-Thr(GGU) m(6)t(6)A37 methyltransferase TsaA